MTLEDFRKVLTQKEGKLISVLRPEMFNANGILSVQCNQGHVWDTSPRYVTKEWWCPQCDMDLIRIKKYIDAKGGKLLSVYVRQNLRVECSRGHSFSVTLRDYQNQWCLKCPQMILDEQMEELGME